MRTINVAGPTQLHMCFDEACGAFEKLAFLNFFLIRILYSTVY